MDARKEDRETLESILQEGILKVEIQQTRDNALRVLNELPARCKEVFIMHRFKGLSHKEIARQLNISPKTVENHMVNALLFFRKRLP